MSKELKNTAVHTPTRADYDEVMQEYERIGWRWRMEQKPTENDRFFDEKEDICIYIGDLFQYGSIGYAKDIDYKILTMAEWRDHMGTTPKSTKAKPAKLLQTVWSDCTYNLKGDSITINGETKSRDEWREQALLIRRVLDRNFK